MPRVSIPYRAAPPTTSTTDPAVPPAGTPTSPTRPRHPTVGTAPDGHTVGPVRVIPPAGSDPSALPAGPSARITIDTQRFASGINHTQLFIPSVGM